MCSCRYYFSGDNDGKSRNIGEDSGSGNVGEDS